MAPGMERQYPATNAALVAVLALAVLPVALWCVHVLRTASPGGPLAGRVFYSLGEGAAAQRAGYSLLGSPDFYRQMLDDLTGVTLTPVGFVLALAGLCHRRWRRYAVWLLAMIVLPLALPRKFHEMNYYFMAVLPPLCIMVGLGWDVVRRRIRPGPMATAVLLLAAVVLSLRYAARPAFVTPAEDRAVVAAAREARRLIPEDEPVVDDARHVARPALLLQSPGLGTVTRHAGSCAGAERLRPPGRTLPGRRRPGSVASGVGPFATGRERRGLPHLPAPGRRRRLQSPIGPPFRSRLAPIAPLSGCRKAQEGPWGAVTPLLTDAGPGVMLPSIGWRRSHVVSVAESQTTVGWVERSEPHQRETRSVWWGSLRSTHPTDASATETTSVQGGRTRLVAQRDDSAPSSARGNGQPPAYQIHSPQGGPIP